MIQQMEQKVQTESDPYEVIANENDLTIDRQKYWVYVRDVDTNYPLKAFRTWAFDALSENDFEAAIKTAIDEFEPTPVEIPTYTRRHSLITGRFKRMESAS